jgi:hypothetical protein
VNNYVESEIDDSPLLLLSSLTKKHVQLHNENTHKCLIKNRVTNEVNIKTCCIQVDSQFIIHSKNVKTQTCHGARVEKLQNALNGQHMQVFSR